jgi:heat shock protein HslJ
MRRKPPEFFGEFQNNKEGKMKKFVKTIVLLMCVAVIAASCANAPETSGAQAPAVAADAAGADSSGIQPPAANDFSNVQEKGWYLAEIRIGQERIVINRAVWAGEGFGNNFTLRFDENQIGGAGAPNRYRGPYSLEESNGMSIGMIASTQIFAFREPEEIKEHEFFALLANVVKWNLAGKNLELYSEREDGTEAVLVFVPAE